MTTVEKKTAPQIQGAAERSEEKNERYRRLLNTAFGDEIAAEVSYIAAEDIPEHRTEPIVNE